MECLILGFVMLLNFWESNLIRNYRCRQTLQGHLYKKHNHILKKIVIWLKLSNFIVLNTITWNFTFITTHALYIWNLKLKNPKYQIIDSNIAWQILYIYMYTLYTYINLENNFGVWQFRIDERKLKVFEIALIWMASIGSLLS